MIDKRRARTQMKDSTLLKKLPANQCTRIYLSIRSIPSQISACKPIERSLIGNF